MARYFSSVAGAGVGVGVVDVDAFPPAAGAGTPRDDQYAALFEFNWFARLLAFALLLPLAMSFLHRRGSLSAARENVMLTAGVGHECPIVRHGDQQFSKVPRVRGWSASARIIWW